VLANAHRSLEKSTSPYILLSLDQSSPKLYAQDYDYPDLLSASLLRLSTRGFSFTIDETLEISIAMRNITEDDSGLPSVQKL